jgi:hypothetical protein
MLTFASSASHFPTESSVVVSDISVFYHHNLLAHLVMLVFGPGPASFVAVGSAVAHPILPTSTVPPATRFKTIFPDSRVLPLFLSHWWNPFVLPSCAVDFGPAEFLHLLNHLVEQK